MDGGTRLIALLGDPVAQVRAPLVLTRLCERFGVNVACIPVHATSADFDAVVDGLKRMGNLAGLMITVPHKISILRHLDRTTPHAGLVGAVNLVRREPDGAWLGDNSDGLGFAAGLAAHGVQVKSRHVLLVGAGGAGTAIAFALAEHAPASLAICDTDTARAVGLVTRVAAAFPALEVRVTGPEPEGCDLAINATHLGMEESDPLPFPVGRAPRGAVVAEVIMKPAITRLLREAGQHGLRTHPGRYMMDFQVPQFASFFRLGEGDWRIELAGES